MTLKTANRKTSVSRPKVRKAIKSATEVKNTYKVPVKLWKTFKTDAAKNVFNEVMNQSLKNKSITIHPKQAPCLPQVHWRTICWNMACYAAWAVSKQPLEKGDTVIDIDRNDKEVRRRKVA